jgi:hypothetical protein
MVTAGVDGCTLACSPGVLVQVRRLASGVAALCLAAQEHGEAELLAAGTAVLEYMGDWLVRRAGLPGAASSRDEEPGRRQQSCSPAWCRDVFNASVYWCQDVSNVCLFVFPLMHQPKLPSSRPLGQPLPSPCPGSSRADADHSGR